MSDSLELATGTERPPRRPLGSVTSGRVGHEQVLKQMRESDIVVVPSRPSFPEGMPFVIQEGLAVRTPLVISDHPVFVESFREDEGVRFFPAENLAALAQTLGRLLDDPSGYEHLSRSTLAAWESVQVETKFHDLLERLSNTWALGSAEQMQRHNSVSSHIG